MNKESARNMATGMAAVLAFTGLPFFLSTAHADPTCVVSTSGKPGRESLTITVTKNPCGRQVRAYTKCITHMGTSTTKTGSVVTSGKSKVDCGTALVHGGDRTWGHDVNVPGQGWTRYPH